MTIATTQRTATPADVDKTEAKFIIHQFSDALTGRNGEDLSRLACRYCDVKRINYLSPSQA